MTDALTGLDHALAAMDAAPGDEAPRRRFYALFADTELCLLLDDTAPQDRHVPLVHDLSDGRFALAFDSEERMARFLDAPARYIALPGRVIAGILAAGGVGIGLNLGVSPHAFLMPAAAAAWLAETLDGARPVAATLPAAFAGLRPPGLPPALLDSLRDKLARLAGHAERLLLAETEDGGNLAVFVGARPASEPALAKALAEALAFSGADAALDAAFLRPDDPRLPALAAVALDLPVPDLPVLPPRHAAPAAPGMDPDRPPRLR